MAQIKEKFSDCAAQAVEKNVAEKIYAMLNEIGTQPFNEFWPLVRRG